MSSLYLRKYCQNLTTENVLKINELKEILFPPLCVLIVIILSIVVQQSALCFFIEKLFIPAKAEALAVKDFPDSRLHGNDRVDCFF